MKIKKIALSIATVGLLTMPSLVSADEDEDQFSWLDRDTWSVEASGEIDATIGAFTSKGSTHNPKLNSDGTNKTHSAGDLYRSEITAKLFLNQEIGETTSWHAGLQLNKDGNAEDGYDFTRNYSQFDWLRELYIDTTSGENVSWRIGKQQVVWGKADGVKFLDIINPTDFRHWGQDSMEDSRIPLWMITGEYALSDNSSLQVVYVPQTDITNQISGLYNTSTGDQGEKFVPMGMDTMFGSYNGFMNIGPELGNVASAFTGAFNNLLPNWSNPNILAGFTNMTVSMFAGFDGSNLLGGHPTVDQFLLSTAPVLAGASGYTSAIGVVNGIGATTNGNTVLDNTVKFTSATTNLFGGTLNTANPTSMFDYMGDTTFATFDAFQGMSTRYVKDHPANAPLEGNLGIRYSGTNDDIGLNYTLNYYYHYDNNPVIDISWEDGAGNALSVNPDKTVAGYTTIKLQNANSTPFVTSAANRATMVFTEKQNRVNTFGLSFDYAIDNSFAPVIVRSEIVYDKDTLVPTVDLGKLAYGDLAGAFTNQRADFLNYVVGLDVTVMTNLFVSFQFMDKWNLDFVDEKVQYQGNTRAYSKHTANAATMSLSNGFKKAEEHAIAYTFFLSKPFLEGDALRVNNIFLLENENFGYWDRFDLEYSYSDDIVLTAAYNLYGGDSNGVFGQFQKMSNAQIGFKYIF